LTEFYIKRDNKNRLNTQCKVCCCIARKAYQKSDAFKEAQRKREARAKKRNITTKTCTKCWVKKPVKEFSVARHHTDGLKSHCKVCVRSSIKTYRKTKKGKKAQHKYYGSDKSKESCAKYYASEKGKAWHRKYRASEKGKAASYKGCFKHNALKRAATISPVDEDAVYKMCDYTCTYCGSTEKLSLDHIIPLSKGGPHAQSNLTVACRSCNSSKNATPLDTWLKTRTKNKGKENVNVLRQTDAFSC